MGLLCLLSGSDPDPGIVTQCATQRKHVLIGKYFSIEEMQNSSLVFDHVGFGTSYDLGMGIGFAILSVIGDLSFSRKHFLILVISRWNWKLVDHPCHNP